MPALCAIVRHIHCFTLLWILQNQTMCISNCVFQILYFNESTIPAKRVFSRGLRKCYTNGIWANQIDPWGRTFLNIKIQYKPEHKLIFLLKAEDENRFSFAVIYKIGYIYKIYPHCSRQNMDLKLTFMVVIALQSYVSIFSHVFLWFIHIIMSMKTINWCNPLAAAQRWYAEYGFNKCKQFLICIHNL